MDTPRTNFKWDQPSRVDQQLAAQAAEQANRDRVYAEVIEREHSRCRICNAYADRRAKTALKKGHPHHVIYESACGPTTVENVCWICATCHNEEHMHRLKIEGNANDSPWLTLWKKDRLGVWGEVDQWFIWRRETGIREYEHD